MIVFISVSSRCNYKWVLTFILPKLGNVFSAIFFSANQQVKLAIIHDCYARAKLLAFICNNWRCQSVRHTKGDRGDDQRDLNTDDENK